MNEDFLTAAEGVIAALDSVQNDLNQVSGCCDHMTSWVLENKASTAGLLQETERLQRALELSQTRSELLGTFLQQYQLTPAESAALQSETMTSEFFAALDHVRTIHGNCKSLLRTHHQRAGLDLLDSMASLQEGAYERLCRWVQAECRGLSDIDSPEVDPLLQRAVSCLKARQVLFKYCAEEVASARQSALFQRFIRALTRGARPIEMHAPDPYRYTSDIMAWVHTSLASEHEFVSGLLGEGEGSKLMMAAMKNGGGGSGDFTTTTDDDHAQEASQSITMQQLLATVFEGICRPLRVRVEQVLMSSPPPLLSFRVAQLLGFYLQTVDGMLGVTSPLSDTLRACHSMAMRTFYEHLKHRGDRLIRHPPQPPADLSLPSQLSEGITLASDLVDNYEGSLLSQDTTSSSSSTIDSTDPTDDDFDAVLSAVLIPLITAAERSSEALNPQAAGRVDDGANMDPADQHIYVINCLNELQRPLLGHSCAAPRVTAIRAAVEAHVSKLAAGEVQRILSGSGLAEVSERLTLYERSWAADVEGTAAADPALALPKVAEAMRTFFGKLSDPAALPEFRKLQVPLVKAEALERCLTALADAYAQVYAALTDVKSGYPAEEVAQVVRHTPAQVRTLLGASSA